MSRRLLGGEATSCRLMGLAANHQLTVADICGLLLSCSSSSLVLIFSSNIDKLVMRRAVITICVMRCR